MQSDSVGVERRRLPFTLIENIILEDQALGPVDILVYLALAKHADGAGTCWPSMATIARVARVCRSKAFVAIRHLEVCGYLRRTARFRPDGGVTSNTYKLMPMETRKYPPLTQDDTPRIPERLPPVHQVHTNYIHLELDPSKERAEHAPRPAPATSHELAPVSLSALLERIKHEAQTRGAPPCFIGGGWCFGIGELVKAGVSEEEVFSAFRACIETAPERVTFFPRDFLKWRKVSRERAAGQQEKDQGRADHLAREREQALEREKLLREREDPYWQAQMEAAIAQLPWRRRQRS